MQLSCYECGKCNAICHVLHIPFSVLEPTVTFWWGWGTWFRERMSRDDEKQKPVPFLRSFRPITICRNQSRKWLNSFHLKHKSVELPLFDETSQKLILNRFMRSQSTVKQPAVSVSDEGIQWTLIGLLDQMHLICKGLSHELYSQLSRDSLPSLAFVAFLKARIFGGRMSAIYSNWKPTRNYGDERRSTLNLERR